MSNERPGSVKDLVTFRPSPGENGSLAVLEQKGTEGSCSKLLYQKAEAGAGASGISPKEKPALPLIFWVT